jgi:hypothetical protein
MKPTDIPAVTPNEGLLRAQRALDVLSMRAKEPADPMLDANAQRVALRRLQGRKVNGD